MANKFQKSILERLEQDSIRQKQVQKTKPAGPAEEPKKTEAAVSEATVKEKAPGIEKVVLPKAKEKVTAGSSLDLSEYLVQDSRRNAKNKTFYLDVDVIEAIKTAARQQNVNDSKLVNDILKKILKV